ncbi:MAG: hypothetical protein WBV85_11020 [Solirubrobacteraceae bacterium]
MTRVLRTASVLFSLIAWLQPAWLQPPVVLPLPSRTGADGPPRPFGAEPPAGVFPGHTASSWRRAQNHALLYGPFPQGGLQRGVSDGVPMLSEDPSVRALTMTRIKALGGAIARIPVDWRDTVEASPPPGFQASDPASSSYRFARLDAAVRSAVVAGLQPLLVVSHAPAFAEAPHPWPYAYRGSWAPSPVAFEQFAMALARRYDGAFPDPLDSGGTLPRVRLLQAWNEPNLARYLEPQWVANGRHWSAFSPLLYRQLLNGFYAGVKAVEPGDTVIAAGIAPEGEPAGVGAMAPVTFLEGLLCLGAARVDCGEEPHMDVLAFHPLSVFNPDVPAVSSLDSAVSDIGKITGLLRRAEKLHTVLPAGRRPVWVTELNWESAPQSATGVPQALQAAWVSRALHRLWVAGVSLVDWQFLVDPYGGTLLSAPDGSLSPYPRPAGLYSAGPGGDPVLARPKPFLQGFSLPFDPLRVNRGLVRVWALLRAPDEPAALQRQGPGGHWRTIARLRADHAGVLNVLYRWSGRVRLRLHVDGRNSASEWVPRTRSHL